MKRSIKTISPSCKKQIVRAYSKKRPKSKSKSKSNKKSAARRSRLAYMKKNFAVTIGADGKRYFMVPEPKTGVQQRVPMSPFLNSPAYNAAINAGRIPATPEGSPKYGLAYQNSAQPQRRVAGRSYYAGSSVQQYEPVSCSADSCV